MNLIKNFGVLLTGLSLAMLSGMAVGAQPSTATVGSAGVVRYIEKGQPPVVIHLTVEQAQSLRESHGGGRGKPGGGSKTKNLIYNGGTGGTGVETAPRIYLVLWGSQWSNAVNDPSGEEALLQDFLADMGGSSWLNTVTQYCQDVSSGSSTCTSSPSYPTPSPVSNYSSMLYGVWYDSNQPAPNRPKQSQFATEAVVAASYFGNTAPGSNDNAQYVIATASGYSSSGFGKQYCAYHSYTTSSYGDIAYTNLPYITDAGPSCGANFNNLGPDAGITIVEGHEAAETITDPFPSSGWLDSSGEEIGDKCAWISSGQGAAADVQLFGDTTDSNTTDSSTNFDTDNDTVNGGTPVQSLWSNAFNSGAGGCVQHYP